MLIVGVITGCKEASIMLQMLGPNSLGLPEVHNQYSELDWKATQTK